MCNKLRERFVPVFLNPLPELLRYPRRKVGNAHGQVPVPRSGQLTTSGVDGELAPRRDHLTFTTAVIVDMKEIIRRWRKEIGVRITKPFLWNAESNGQGFADGPATRLVFPLADVADGLSRGSGNALLLELLGQGLGGPFGELLEQGTDPLADDRHLFEFPCVAPGRPRRFGTV